MTPGPKCPRRGSKFNICEKCLKIFFLKTTMQKYWILLWIHPLLLSILNCWNRYPRFYTGVPRGVQNLTKKYIGKHLKIFFFKTTMLQFVRLQCKDHHRVKILNCKSRDPRPTLGLGSKFNTEVYWENFFKNYIAYICEITMQIFSNSVDSKLLKPTLGPILWPRKGVEIIEIEIAFGMK